MRSTILTSSPLHYFWWYLAGILTLPILGFGAYLMYRTEKKRRAHIIEIHEGHVVIRHRDEARTIHLDAIHSISLQPSAFPASLAGIGSLVLDAGAGKAHIGGIRAAEGIKKALETAIASMERAKRVSESIEEVPTTVPGGDDRLNELTLMWQQGLISEEDFLKEQKHFKG